MKRLDYVLCDLGIISRCSAVLQWSCNANREILTVCSSRKATWSFMSSDTTRTMPLCSPLKYLYWKHFVVIYPFGRATYILSSQKNLVPAFPSSLHISCHFQRTILHWSTVACHQHHFRCHTWSLNGCWGQQRITWLNIVLRLGHSIQCGWTAVVYTVDQALPSLCGSALACNRAIQKAPHWIDWM